MSHRIKFAEVLKQPKSQNSRSANVIVHHCRSTAELQLLKEMHPYIMHRFLPYLVGYYAQSQRFLAHSGIGQTAHLQKLPTALFAVSDLSYRSPK